MMDEERFVADVLTRAGADAGPERVSARYADERIADKIARFDEPKQREGLHLSRIAEETRGERRRA